MKQVIYKFGINNNKISELFNGYKYLNKKIVFTNGCFDILHVGHLRYLKKAKELGDVLAIGLNSDKSVKKIKGDKRPIVPELERAEMLLSLKFVDHVIIFDEETPLKLIKKINPDFLVKGGDWQTKNIVGSDFIRNNGGEVKAIKYEENHSTTDIINKIISSVKI